MERIGNSRVAANIRSKLALSSETGAPKNIRRDIGLVDHWIKREESLAYWENEVQLKRAIRVERGRYRSLVRDATGSLVPGAHEELFEWKITNSKKQIDTGLVNHAEKTVCIVDKAAQMDSEHLAKGVGDGVTEGYVQLVQKAFPGFSVKYVEYYWDEKSGDFVIGNVAHY